MLLAVAEFGLLTTNNKKKALGHGVRKHHQMLNI
jgi:hypothetical protein